MSDAKWGRLHGNDNYKTLHRGGTVIGWVVMIDDKWIARNPQGTVRADFDTMEEAQQFLTVMVSAGDSNEEPM